MSPKNVNSSIERHWRNFFAVNHMSLKGIKAALAATLQHQQLLAPGKRDRNQTIGLGSIPEAKMQTITIILPFNQRTRIFPKGCHGQDEDHNKVSCSLN